MKPGATLCLECGGYILQKRMGANRLRHAGECARKAYRRQAKLVYEMVTRKVCPTCGHTWKMKVR